MDRTTLKVNNGEMLSALNDDGSLTNKGVNQRPCYGRCHLFERVIGQYSRYATDLKLD